MKKITAKLQRQRRIRSKIHGTTKVPRLSVYRSNRGIYAQLIDDQKQQTLLGISERHLDEVTGTRIERAKKLGELLAKKAKEYKILQVVFDKGSYRYHGRIKEVAEGAREGGLKF